jgi:hypothetical protein
MSEIKKPQVKLLEAFLLFIDLEIPSAHLVACKL